MPLTGAWRHVLCSAKEKPRAEPHPSVCETLVRLALDRCVVYETSDCDRILTLYRLHGCDTIQSKEEAPTPMDFLPPVG